MKRSVSILWMALVLVAGAASAQIFSVDIPAPDGTLLATDVYVPPTFLPLPVVLARTPYGKADLAPVCLALNLRGMACVAQDTRGTHGSGGANTVFRDDGPDGRATLEWIAEQWWCDGHVGTIGASALGVTQYALAPGAPSELTCMMPAIATPDLYHHAMYQGGAMREALVTIWLDRQDALDFLDELRLHRLWDNWWQEVDALAEPATVTAPALHFGGWYDIFSQGTLDAFTIYEGSGGPGAAGQQYLIMGPWTHGSAGTTTSGELHYPANAAVDYLGLMDDWLRYWLHGAPSGVDSWPKVEVYLMGAVGEPGAPGNEWITFPSWPPPSRAVSFFLWPGGELDLAVPAAASLTLEIDPEEPVPTLGGANLFPELEVDGRPMGAGPYDQQSIEARDDVLVFTTEPLDRPLVIVGRVHCELWVRPDTPDLDLSVRLTDVYPDGRSMLITDGIQRARMRCGDDRECFLEPGVTALIEVDLWSTALAFNQGHSIRIAIAGSNWPRFEVNPNDGGDLNTGTPVVAHPELLLGPEHPSALVLPVQPGPRGGGRRVQSPHLSERRSRRYALLAWPP
jgi:predicted acyl esterase